MWLNHRIRIEPLGRDQKPDQISWINDHFSEAEALHHGLHPLLVVLAVVGIPGQIDYEPFYLFMISAGIVGMIANTCMRLIQSKFWQTEKPAHFGILMFLIVFCEFLFILLSFDISLRYFQNQYTLEPFITGILPFSLIIMVIGYAVILSRFMIDVFLNISKISDDRVLSTYNYQFLISSALLVLIISRSLVGMVFSSFGGSIIEIVVRIFLYPIFEVFTLFEVAFIILIPLSPLIVVLFGFLFALDVEPELHYFNDPYVPLISSIILIITIFRYLDNKSQKLAIVFSGLALWYGYRSLPYLISCIFIVIFVSFYWRSPLCKFEKSFTNEMIPIAVNEFITESYDEIPVKDRLSFLINNLNHIAMKVRYAQSFKGFRIPIIAVQEYLFKNGQFHLDPEIWENFKGQKRTQSADSMDLWPTMDDKAKKKGRLKIKGQQSKIPRKIRVPEKPNFRNEILRFIMKICLLGLIPFIFFSNFIF